jgi:hypothetical protein
MRAEEKLPPAFAGLAPPRPKFFLSFRETIHGHPVEAANATGWRAGWIDCQESKKTLEVIGRPDNISGPNSHAFQAEKQKARKKTP